MVGYEHELASLEEVLEQALAGRGGLTLIAGEPGVGKTRLADELGAVANARGAQVVWGRCATGTGAPAYWAWIQALRSLVSDRDALMLRAELGAGAAELVQLLPELRDVVPDLDPVEYGDTDDVRFRLFDAAAGFLVRAAATQPLLIVLDDLHSADQSTRSLLEFLAPVVLDARVLIVATYRDTEAIADTALGATLTALARTTDCLQLVLSGLAPDDTAHFVELSARVAPMPLLASAIHEVTSGNPLFVSELIRLLATENRLHELERDELLSLPRGVDQVIARRLEHLSPASREMLSLAAVIGRDFDSALLARVADAPNDELLGQMEGAVAARIVEPSPTRDRTMRFSHDLIRQALHAALPAAERCRVHAAVGRELERLHGTSTHQVVDQLAYHFSEALPAGDPAKAVEYLTLAGATASELGAGPEAVTYYSRAAEIAKLNDAGAELMCELSVRLAEELVLSGDVSKARAPIEEAQGLSAVVPDRVRDARLSAAQAHLAHFDPSRFDERRILDAIELFEEIGDHASAARAWWAIANVNCGMSDRSSGAESCEHMLECAKRSGSAALTNEARRHLAAVLVTGAVPVSEAVARTRALLEETNDAYVRARMLILLGALEAKQGRFDEGRALIAEARSVAPPHQRVDIEFWVLVYGGRLELLAGNMHRAEELVRAECADLWSQGRLLWLSSELLSLVDPLIALGRLQEASVELERAVSITVAGDVDALLRQERSRARLALARGDIDAAESCARLAIAHAAGADAPDEHADCLLVLARVLHAADRRADAHDVAAQALRLSEQQEHLVFAQQARELLGAAQAAVAG
jgi:tetratricopeptide (TPR) repeat protein